MTTVKVKVYPYFGHGWFNISPKCRKWIQVIFLIFLLLSIAVQIAQMIIASPFDSDSDATITIWIIGILNLCFYPIILIELLCVWFCCGNGLDSNDYEEVTDSKQIDEESRMESSSSSWTYFTILDTDIQSQDNPVGARAAPFAQYQMLIVPNLVVFILTFAGTLGSASSLDQIFISIMLALCLVSIILVYLFSTDMAWMYIPWLFIRIEKRYYPRLIRVKDMSVMEKFDGTILKQHNNFTTYDQSAGLETNNVAISYFRASSTAPPTKPLPSPHSGEALEVY